MRSSSSTLVSVAALAALFACGFQGPAHGQDFALGGYVVASCDDLPLPLDVDGDGALDLISALDSQPGLLWLRREPGSAEFVPEVLALYSSFVSGFSVPEIATADLDVDGDLDVVLSFEKGDRVGWHENLLEVGGGLAPYVDLPIPVSAPTDLVAADIDGDGDPDLIVNELSPGDLQWFENLGASQGFLARGVVLAQLGAGAQILPRDIDGDGDNDLLFANRFDSSVSWVRFDAEAGAFGAPQVLSTTASGIFQADVADVDQDGDLDVLATSAQDDQVVWFPNLDGLGTFGDVQTVTNLAPSPDRVLASDLDEDGDLDVLVSGPLSGLAWCENVDGSGTFGPLTALPQTIGEVRDFALVDLLGLGSQGLLSFRAVGSRVNFFPGVGPGQIFGRAQLVAPRFDDPLGLESADLDGDGNVDIVLSQTTSASVVWYRNDAASDRFPDAARTVGTHPSSAFLRAADLDGDGDADVLAGDPVLGSAVWFPNPGDGGFNGSRRDILATGTEVPDLQLGDLDRDGSLDLVTSDSATGAAEWRPNPMGDGNFGPPLTIVVEVEAPERLALADLDGDGDLDVAYTLFVSGGARWCANLDGLGAFGSAEVVWDGLSAASGVAAGDLDADGDLDLVLGTEFLRGAVWMENSDGAGAFTLGAVLEEGLGDRLEIADLDADGWQDIAGLSESDAILRNEGAAASFTPWVLEQDPNVTNELRSLVIVDLDGSLTLDLVGWAGFAQESLLWISGTRCTGDPQADFEPFEDGGDAPLTVAFGNLSTGTGTLEWLWDFGDGGTSTAQNPTHVYLEDGTYDVSLRVTGSEGSCVLTRESLVVVGSCGSDPVAAFSASPGTGDAPLSVQFQDLSTGGELRAWSWDFGDGRSSQEQSPLHRYFNAGTYDVSLTVTGDGGTCTELVRDAVVVTESDLASISTRNGSGVNPAVLLSSDAPVVGTTWIGQVDLGALGSTGLTTLVAYDRDLPGLPSGLGEVLVDPTSDLVLVDTAVEFGGLATHSLQVPFLLSIAGTTLALQAYAVEAGVLTNALDLVLGF